MLPVKLSPPHFFQCAAVTRSSNRVQIKKAEMLQECKASRGYYSTFLHSVRWTELVPIFLNAKNTGKDVAHLFFNNNLMLDLQGCYILFLIRGNLTFRVGIFIRRLEQSIRMVDTNGLSTQNIQIVRVSGRQLLT